MSMKSTGRNITYTAAFIAYSAAGFSLIYPEIARPIVLDSLNELNNGKDSVIQLLDTNADGCIQTPLQQDFCISAGGYLKAIISETPLTQEETQNLPSFIGEPYPASPFDFSI